MEPGREDREHLDHASNDRGNEVLASMEPGREDREHFEVALDDELVAKPQWNPAVKTGSTRTHGSPSRAKQAVPQWNPAVKTGSTITSRNPCSRLHIASMEPGREDREHRTHTLISYPPPIAASMEPGREDREHLGSIGIPATNRLASMEPGREDREHDSDRPGIEYFLTVPQWNPAVKTGSTNPNRALQIASPWPQWNPAVKTGSTVNVGIGAPDKSHSPQWNPAVKTGSTRRLIGVFPAASVPQWNPAVKTGSTSVWAVAAVLDMSSLNGTRP